MHKRVMDSERYFSDYTFAIFNDEKETEELVPFAKACIQGYPIQI